MIKKLIYGSGDWGLSSLSMMRSVFYAIYLTDVVGLEARLASFGALVGIFWDALNDPLVGRLSDRVRTRWGRRRPFLLIFAVPFAVSMVMLWYAPPWTNQTALLFYVTLTFMLSDTLSTLISVPFLSLTPEIAPGYDDRTTLTGYRTFFQLAAGLAVVVAAPAIVDAVLAGGGTQQQGFLLVAAVFGGLGAIPFLLIFAVIRETATDDEIQTLPLRQTLRLAWQNVPFRYAIGIHMLNWSAVDMIAVTFPYFLLYWIAGGDLLAKVDLFGLSLSLESAFFGLLMLGCILALPFWMWFSHRRNKRDAYVTGMLAMIAVELVIFTVQPGQVGLLLALGFLAGTGIATAYVLPDSIFPDIIEWDELRTRRRQEGIYYGARSFIRKLTGGLTIFLALQLLGWAGYQAPPETATSFQQPERVVTVIRLLVSPAGALLFSGAVAFAWFYPLDRARHARIQSLLSRRKGRGGSPLPTQEP
ncbi:MAG: MFS transporter [Chloroflexota bacterium]